MNIFALTVLTANQQASSYQMYSSLIMIGLVVFFFNFCHVSILI